MKKFIALVLIFATIFLLTGCASMERGMKTITSDWGGGLNRTVTVYDYTGDPIRSWTGKIDISESENEVWFDLNGKRTIIQGGIIIVQED